MNGHLKKPESDDMPVEISTNDDERLKSLDLSKTLIVLIPTPNRKIFVGLDDYFTELASAMGKSKLTVTVNKWGLANARNSLIEALVSRITKLGVSVPDSLRVLWFDSDQTIETPAKQVAEWLIQADKNNWNLVGNYHMLWDNRSLTISNIIFHIDKQDDSGLQSVHPYSNEELADLNNGDILKSSTAGLGFCYMELPLSYKFKDNLNGDDFNMFRDLGIEIRYCPIKILHEKTVLI